MATKMKVLLTKDVEHLGKAGDLKDVSGGYGRNYLIPQGFAVLATKGQVRQSDERLQAQRRKNEVVRRDAEALAARINGTTVRFVTRVGEQDRLYGSVTNSDIGTRLSEQLNIDIDRRKIDLEDPIKRTGIYAVKIRLASGIEPVVNVVVEGEGGSVQVPDVSADAPTSDDSEVPATDDGPAVPEMPAATTEE